MAVKVTILPSMLLLFFVKGFAHQDPNGNRFQWQTLTKTNFSSQIRLHPHVLVMVTVPWSGESRSLMKEITNRAAYKQEKFADLKLMVVYRNTEKLLANVLGGTEGITFICYCHSVSYKYRGRLRAQNILSSFSHLISLQPKELPLKHLNTAGDLKAFLKSTDKAILLLEFCGWTPRLLSNRTELSRATASYVWNAFENEGTSADNLNGETDKQLQLDERKNQKAWKNEKLTCDAGTGLGDISWLGQFTWGSETASSLEVDSGNPSGGMFCTFDEFQQFQSFLLNFTAMTKEYFLPPERQRFGLVSDASLQSLLGGQVTHTWAVIVHIAGCPHCLRIIKEGENLEKTIIAYRPVVTELEGEGYDFESTIPGQEPSMILFVDRSAESTKIRRESKSALEIFRKLALHGYISVQAQKGQKVVGFKGLVEQKFTGMDCRSISDLLGHPVVEPTEVKFKDDLALTVINSEGNVDFENIAGGAHGSAAHELLAYLLQKTNPSLGLKKTKISVLAKQVGFKLLSDDFEVKIVHPPPSQKDAGQSERALDALPSVSDVQLSELPIGSSVEPGDKSFSAITNAYDFLKEEPEFTNEEAGEVDVTKVKSEDDGKTESSSETHIQEAKIDEMAAEMGSQRFGNDSSNIFAEGNIEVVSHYDGKLGLKHDSPNMDLLKETHGQMTDNEQTSYQDSSSLNVEESNGKDVDVHSEWELNGMHLRDIHRKTSSLTINISEEVGSGFFRGSFFFSDGGYRLLKSLTSESEIPSIVIVDPILQRHHVFPKGMSLSYSSLVRFVDEFSNRSLPRYQRSESSISAPREAPLPPFVNLDFHEADSIPRVTVRTFSESVLGFNQCDSACSNIQNASPAWNKDVLVLFTSSSCGFCQRMELVIREVYRAFKGYTGKWGQESKAGELPIQEDKLEDFSLNEPKLPSVFLMNCILNDCSVILESLGQRELYPVLLLFPAKNKNAIAYQGDVSVTNIMEFMAAFGSSSDLLHGILWTRAQKRGDIDVSVDDPSIVIQEQTLVEQTEQEDILLNSNSEKSNIEQRGELETSENFHDGDQQVGVGSILVATEKLLNAPPFDKSKILILKANKDEGFQGVIFNKRIKWDLLRGIDDITMSLKDAPVSFGGPVLGPGLPLVSFTRFAAEGYLGVLPDLFFGDQMVTHKTIEGIKLGNLSATDYWFFLGLSSWSWNQLFDELADGAWTVSSYQAEQLEWPEN